MSEERYFEPAATKKNGRFRPHLNEMVVIGDPIRVAKITFDDWPTFPTREEAVKFAFRKGIGVFGNE